MAGLGSGGFRAEGTVENVVEFSAVPPGRIMFGALNPARCAGLISGVAPRPKRRRLPALVAQVLQKIFDEGLHGLSALQCPN